MAGDMPRWRAAADRLPALAARTKTRILVIRSILTSYYQYQVLAYSGRFCDQRVGAILAAMQASEEFDMHNGNPSHQPAQFIPYGGGPCFFMDWNPPAARPGTGNFLGSVACTLPRKPSAIVMVSAHWMEPEFRVTGHARPELIYDYYGFPQHTYELTYPAPGAPQLAEQLVQTLNAEGLAAAVDP